MKDTELHSAARAGDIERLQELLAAEQCDINDQDRAGMTPLHWAGDHGHTQCVQLLLQHRADTSKQDCVGRTPLHWAAHFGHTQCVQLLLQHGADSSKQDRDERTPLHFAAYGGHTHCVQLLLQHGADTSIQDRGGRTPLHWAADHGHTQCVQLLLQHGADTSIQDVGGMTPLHRAAYGGHTQCVQLLLQHGTDTSIQDVAGMTPLHWAAVQGHTQCAQLLLQHGADTSISACCERTPLHLAAVNGYTQCAQLLLQHGADTSIQDLNETTALHLAAESGHTQCVQLLLQHGADTSIQDRCERTPLHFAAGNGHTQCVQLLLQHGADTSIQDKLFTMTPLHWAARGGHTQCVQLLLQHGADTSVQDEEKKTPRMLAEERERTAVVELLRRFEIHDIQLYIHTRTLEHLAEILDPEEYGIFNLTNLDPNFPDLLQIRKILGVKDWLAMNNHTTIKDIRDGLLAANLPRLSRASVQYYTQVVINISNMPPDEFETLCRTLTTAKYMHQHTPSSTTRGLKSASLPLDQYCQDAFIAHSEEDESTIEPVLLQLKEYGIQCWYDKEDLIPGTYVIYETIEAISASMFSILFLSKRFIQSGRCKYEMENIIRNATEKEHGVIPVVMNITPEEIPDGLRNWKHFFFDDQELVSKILAVIKGPKVIPTYGQLRQENGVLRDENAILRDEVRKLTDKLCLQSQ